MRKKKKKSHNTGQRMIRKAAWDGPPRMYEIYTDRDEGDKLQD